MTTTADYLIAGNHNIPVAVIEQRQFMGSLPVGFIKGRDGKIRHNPEELNLFLCSSERNIIATASKKVVKVGNQEDFAEMRRRLMTKPIFLNIKLKSEYVEHYVVVKRRITSWMYAMVYINPSHPVIKEQLEKQFDECEQLMSEGKNFSFEIRVNQLMKAWYMTCKANAYASYYCYGSTICVTNFTQRCNMCYSPLLWLLPCTWIMGPPYLIYRALSSKDVICELSAVVTLMRQGPQIRIQQNMLPAPTNPPPPNAGGQPPPPNAGGQLPPQMLPQTTLSVIQSLPEPCTLPLPQTTKSVRKDVALLQA